MIIIRRIFLFVGVICFSLLSSCKEDDNPLLRDELPFPTPFNEYINLTLPAYQTIQFENHLYLDNIGLNGVVIVRLDANSYAAYERTCPVNPEEACSIVSHINLGPGSSYLTCDCGEASYDDDNGYPTNSPEPRKLREYYSELSGSTLYIESTIVQ